MRWRMDGTVRNVLIRSVWMSSNRLSGFVSAVMITGVFWYAAVGKEL